MVGLVWASSVFLWFLDRGVVGWRYAVVDAVALAYFYRRWSAPNAQHRQFHFLLMCSYIVTVSFWAYRFAAAPVFPEAASLSARWLQLISNMLFGAELLLVIAYALLFRRAKADPRKWRRDVDRWMDGPPGMFRKAPAKARKPGEDR